MKDFDSITAFFSDREIDELQAKIDARREARAVATGRAPEARTSRHAPKSDEPGSTPRRVVGA